MKSKITLRLALVLSGVSLVGSFAARNAEKSEPWHGFPIIPPITNANPSISHPMAVRLPTKLKIERTDDTLSVRIDSFASTNLMVGTNMVTGVQDECFVYPAGEKRPAHGGLALSGGLDFNLGTSIMHTKPNGIPLPGIKYVVEEDLTAFETDIPAQHMWCPRSGKNYKVLWQRTLKQIVQ